MKAITIKNNTSEPLKPDFLTIKNKDTVIKQSEASDRNSSLGSRRSKKFSGLSINVHMANVIPFAQLANSNSITYRSRASIQARRRQWKHFLINQKHPL